MALRASPSCADDFVLLDGHQIYDLPVRRRRAQHEAEHESQSPSSDDDLEHISGPGSVRSLNTPSPLPSPTLSPASGRNITAVSHLTTQSGTTIPQQYTASIRPTFRVPQRLAEPPRHTSESLNLTLQTFTPAVCHNHETIDQQIMDSLIAHALTTRIEQEYGHGCSKDQKLRQQMMARFRSLPANHAVVKNSITRVEGSKVLFQGQLRSLRDIEYIYLAVFTDVERMALNYLVQCHIQRFKRSCAFHDTFMPSTQEALYNAMRQQGSEEGKQLALSVHWTILERLDIDRASKDLSDDLRQEARHRVAYLASLSARIGSSPPGSLRPYFSHIFQETIMELPSDKLQPQLLMGQAPRATSTLKREPPEDEDGQGQNSNPPSKRLQPATHPSRLVSRAYSCESTIQHSPTICSAPANYGNGSVEQLFLWNGVDGEWSSTTRAYDYETGLVLQNINLKMERLFNLDKKAPSKHQGICRKYGEIPYAVQLFMLEQQCKGRHAMARQNRTLQPSGAPHFTKLDTNSFDPYLQPVGHLCENFKSSYLQRYDRPLSKHERIWITEHATRCAEKAPSAQRAGIEDKFIQDAEIVRHVSRLGFGIIDYAFRMDALLLLKSMHFVALNGHLSKDDLLTSEQPRSEAHQVRQAQLMVVEQKAMIGAYAKKWAAMHSQSAPEEASLGQAATTISRQRQIEMQVQQALSHRFMLLEQSNTRRLQLCEQMEQENDVAQSSEKGYFGFESDMSKIAPSTHEAEALKHNHQRGRSFGSSDLQKTENYENGLADLPARPAHLVSHSQLPQANADDPRCYRADTLLARSTQLPVLSAENLDGVPGSTEANMFCVGGDSRIKEEYSETSKAAPKYLLGPGAQYPSKALTEYQKQIALIEKARERQKGKAEEKVSLPHHIHQAPSNFVSDPHREDILSTMVQHDYQQQLMLLERANRRRLMLRRQEEQERNGGSTLDEQQHLPPPTWFISAGVRHMRFTYGHSGRTTEYTLRADIESVNVDALSPSFKDDNCLHSSCEGWKSTPERILEAQKENWRRLKLRMNVADRHPEQVQESPTVLQQKLNENNIAWCLAELNVCLRVHTTKDLLRTAVKHFMIWKSATCPPKQHDRSQEMPRTSTEKAEESLVVPAQTKFIQQNPDEIMNDPDLEESSSSSEDDCDEEEDESDDESSFSGFPRNLVDAYGGRYMIFRYTSITGSDPILYVVRADVDQVNLDSRLRSFTLRNCICRHMWVSQTNEPEHTDDCKVAIKLAYQNPMLHGTENMAIRHMAMTNYVQLTRAVKNKSQGSDTIGLDERILISDIPESELEMAFVEFRSNPDPGPLTVQCIYCHRILDEFHHVYRAVHLTSCMAYCRHRDVDPNIVTCGTSLLRSMLDD